MLSTFSRSNLQDAVFEFSLIHGEFFARMSHMDLLLLRGWALSSCFYLALIQTDVHDAKLLARDRNYSSKRKLLSDLKKGVI